MKIVILVLLNQIVIVIQLAKMKVVKIKLIIWENQ